MDGLLTVMCLFVDGVDGDNTQANIQSDCRKEETEELAINTSNTVVYSSSADKRVGVSI